MEICGPKLRQRLLDHGLKTDESGDRVLFPADVVDRAIASAPKSFTLYDRDGKPHAEIGGYNVHYVPGSSGLKIMDHRSGETRLANSTDFVEYARLCDGLEHIAYLATAFSTNADIEAQVSDAWRLYMAMINSKKPVVSGAFGEHGVPRMAEMMQLFRRDRAELIAKPMSIFTVTATGNFRFGEDSCQNLLDCVEAGIPIEIVPVTLMGLIAPVTLVGALVFHCVDVLTGITMAQIVKPGAPVLFGGAPATFHMKAASAPMAAIEAQHLNVGYVAIAKSLGLPTQAYMALGDGKFLDAQAGAETMASAHARRARRRQLGVRSRHARLRADLQPAEAGVRQRSLRSVPAFRARDSRARGPAVWRPSELPSAEPPPDYGTAHAEVLAAGVVPDRPGHRPGKPRELGHGRIEGPLSARLRTGGPAPRGVYGFRHRCGH